MDINSMSPASGRIIAEDGSVVNAVDLLNTGSVAPISNKIHNINSYSPRSGRIIGEDGKLYNLVDLLQAGGGGGGGNASHEEELRINTTGDEEITIFQGSVVPLENGKFYVFDANVVLNAGNLEGGSAFAIGLDYYIYISNSGGIVISLNATASAGHRKISGFHYGVNRRNATAPGNVYNGIVPRSIWTNTHRPKCAPEGMVYLYGGVWIDIYLSSDDGAGGVVSKYNVLPLTGVESLTWYAANDRLFNVGKRMLTYREFVLAATGSPPGTSSGNENAWTAAAERAPTGFVQNAVSMVGCRDCVGNVWEWLSDIIGSGIGETPGWFDPMSGQNQGQMWINAQNDFRALLAGGSYFNGALVGARSVCTLFSPWNDNPSFGVRGACESL